MVVSHGFVQRGCYNRGPFPRQVAMSSKWKLEKRYESVGIKPKLCSYRPGRGDSTLVHLFGFVASNGGADAADINVGADAADNDTTMQATFFTYKPI